MGLRRHDRGPRGAPTILKPSVIRQHVRSALPGRHRLGYLVYEATGIEKSTRPEDRGLAGSVLCVSLYGFIIDIAARNAIPLET